MIGSLPANEMYEKSSVPIDKTALSHGIMHSTLIKYLNKSFWILFLLFEFLNFL